MLDKSKSACEGSTWAKFLAQNENKDVHCGNCSLKM